ncbi:hypothetical protein [Prosthecobacter vanneervenii]|uniref:Uncharacterized membrane protein HdeD (DUF308 family) n=1 Tax=Prosthecobacter vanneervenii TaxID=48466 RepID=A0A7W7YBG9_9BACT|nr:hypothetical protein [Prosthecobacter vanneervenii]MBB5033054.1 uncharacterized membrane protein HdeD (DUF308 family) [Prosthecobacter vanneervenii]
MEINPYAAPQSQILQATSSDELIRQEHINTEATLKSVGILYYLGAFVLTLMGGMALFGSLMNGETASVLLGLFFLIIGVTQGVAAYGLRRLQSWARVPTIILSCIGLLGFPLGTLINLYILVKVAGKQGKFILTPEYQRIVAATPHVKRKTSIVMKIALALLFIILLGIIISVSLSQLKQY